MCETDAVKPPIDGSVQQWLKATLQTTAELDIADEAFAAFVAARVCPLVAETLRTRHGADLALACAAADGKPAALRKLEATCWPAIERALERYLPNQSDRRDIVATLRNQMLVGARQTVPDTCSTPRPAPQPGIASYDGRAPLVAWLRVCATRLATRLQATQQRQVPTAPDILSYLAPGVPDPALDYMKQLYGASFEQAFRHAVAALSPRQRNLLRYSTVEGLSIDQIGAIYHMHRATAARQLQAARLALSQATRDQLRATLQVSEPMLDSILRVMLSNPAFTLSSVFAPPAATVPR